MQQFVRGQKARLSDLTASTKLNLTLNVNGSTPNVAFDISCFGVDAAEKLSDDRYFIFFNQKSSPCGGIVSLGAQGDDKEVFQIDLAKLPSTIRKLVFTITIDGAGTMAQIANGYLRILDQNSEVVRFNFSGSDFKEEKALIVGEIYMKDIWRFAAVGQGFNGGLSALLKHFGGEEIEEQAPPAPVEPVVQPPKKVLLDKPGQAHKISLAKGPENLLIVRAQWFDNNDGKDDNDDLDLRVGMLLPNGQMYMIHADDTGSLNTFPYIEHQGDVKEPGEEIVKVRTDISSLLGGNVALVFSVYSAVQNGAVSVASLRPKMRIENGSDIIECAYDYTLSIHPSLETYIYTYVIGLAVFNGDTAQISPSGTVSLPHSESTPRLQWRSPGEAFLTMDGPQLFKQS